MVADLYQSRSCDLWRVRHLALCLYIIGYPLIHLSGTNLFIPAYGEKSFFTMCYNVLQSVSKHILETLKQNNDAAGKQGIYV